MDLDIKELGEYISNTISANVDDVAFAQDELTLSVPVASLIKVLSFLRDDANCQFKQLMDVCGIDYPAQEKRFGVVYNLLSLTLNLRVRVKVWTDEDTPVPTATGLFSSANWFEREVWDMYGIFFYGHTDLRRILNNYGFNGYAMRKDFSLNGYVSFRYDDLNKMILSEPTELTQFNLDFNYQKTPWRVN